MVGREALWEGIGHILLLKVWPIDIPIQTGVGLLDNLTVHLDYPVVSLTSRASPRMMARNLPIDRAAPRSWPPRKTLARAAVPYGPFILTPSRGACAAVIALTSPLLRQKPLDFGAVLPQQPLQVQHARP